MSSENIPRKFIIDADPGKFSLIFNKIENYRQVANLCTTSKILEYMSLLLYVH